MGLEEGGCHISSVDMVLILDIKYLVKRIWAHMTADANKRPAVIGTQDPGA